MTKEEKEKICMECGECCKQIGILVDSTQNNFLAAWGWKLRPITGTPAMSATILHPCQHYVNNRCDIYETRPIFCREYWACDDPALKHLCKLPSKEAQ